MIYLTILSFVLSAGMAAWGIMLGVSVRSDYKMAGFTSLLYYLMFVFTFGFYAMWGQSIVKMMVSEFLSPDQIGRIIHTFILMGLPFLVIAWLMLIRFAREITLRERSKYLTSLFITVNLGLIFGIGFILNRWPGIDALTILKYFYLGPGFVYTLYACATLLIHKEKRYILAPYDRKIIAGSFVLFFVAEGITLYFYQGNEIAGLLFVIIFFTGKAFTISWIKYGADLSRLMAPRNERLSLAGFCTKFEISARESEIIREICLGLSNGEIADKLFITLQTVKDHTHRIYIKTNVRNRMQLMTLAREHGI